MNTRSHQQGLTAIEAVATMAILAVTMIPLFASMQRSISAHQTVVRRDTIEERARKVTQRLKHHLQNATMDALAALPDWPTTTSTMTYSQTDAFDDQVVGEPEAVIVRDESLDFSGNALSLTTGPSTVLLASDLTSVTFSKEEGRLRIDVRIDGTSTDNRPVTVKRKIYVSPRHIQS